MITKKANTTTLKYAMNNNKNNQEYIDVQLKQEEEEEEGIFTEETPDSFNERRRLLSTTFSLNNHANTLAIQHHQQLDIIKNIMSPFNEVPFNLFSTSTQHHSNITIPQSKKDMLKAKREKTKHSIIVKKQSIDECKKNQDDFFLYKEISKQAKIDR